MISIVTATFNCKQDILLLISNMIDLKNISTQIEWIVVDGESNDGTLEVLRDSGVVDKLLSEKDFGIYDALNKGIKLATYNYYIILGADDSLNINSWSNIEKIILKADEDIGVHVFPVLVNNELRVPKSNVWFNTQRGIISNHSVGICVDRRLHDIYGYYSSKYSLAADQYFIIGLYRKGVKFRFHNTSSIGNYNLDGASGRYVQLVSLQLYDIMTNLGYSWIIQLPLLIYRLIKARFIRV